ncbi:hypothetical protein [Yersinia ruckeri]|uniref:hypothetical protein n=1 Tax=Yersinia ruckeri TaxID=29486 RepID=UPI002237E2AB|nr:hypothetical protein [Yersinia ruckeri]MCW6598620.1 hypothetical protein [Yersinia ruckeri]
MLNVQQDNVNFVRFTTPLNVAAKELSSLSDSLLDGVAKQLKAIPIVIQANTALMFVTETSLPGKEHLNNFLALNLLNEGDRVLYQLNNFLAENEGQSRLSRRILGFAYKLYADITHRKTVLTQDNREDLIVAIDLCLKDIPAFVEVYPRDLQAAISALRVVRKDLVEGVQELSVPSLD